MSTRFNLSKSDFMDVASGTGLSAVSGNTLALLLTENIPQLAEYSKTHSSTWLIVGMILTVVVRFVIKFFEGVPNEKTIVTPPVAS